MLNAHQVLHLPKNVQVLPARLHHDRVGPLFQIPFNCPHRQSARGRGQLVAFPVSHLGRRARSLPERSVQRRREFSGIRHDHDFVQEVIRCQFLLDCENAAVHHVRGRENVGTGDSIGEGDGSNPADRSSVV